MKKIIALLLTLSILGQYGNTTTKSSVIARRVRTPHTVIFDPDEHTYTINGERYPSVTTITGVLFKKGLMFWGIKITVQHIIERFNDIKDINSNHAIRYYYSAKKNNGKARKIGSLTHIAIERYLNGQKYYKTKIIENPFNAFLDWDKEHKFSPLVTESIAFSIEHQYAGTVDAIGYIDNELCVIDWKTSKDIYPEYYMQISGYTKAIQELGGAWKKVNSEYRFIPMSNIDRVLIVRFDKETAKWEMTELNNTQIEIEAEKFRALSKYYNLKE